MNKHDYLNYFLDFEFHEYQSQLWPISMGMICEDRRELYIEFLFNEQEVCKTNPWVVEHVLPKLKWEKSTRVPLQIAAQQILGFTKAPPNMRPRIWGYYSSTDWVLFYRSFDQGRLIDLPQPLPKNCLDLQQWFVMLGCPEGVKPPKPAMQHDALEDARWNLDFYNALREYEASRGR